jgi:hypothetical protein
MSQAIASLVVYLDPETGDFKAEIPAPNGSRRKISLPRNNDGTGECGCDCWQEIIETELSALNTWLRHNEKRQQELETNTKTSALDAEKRFQRSLHRKIWDITAIHHNYGQTSGLEFANKTIGPRSGKEQLVNLI